ncbi:peptide transport protein, POT family [Legionella lansingensis]|uniref:Peptide transport protein, POT family n=1 Tax=Legionella lansingensis TaxID=45067 RepID=A0A0W0VSG1_9GAMM|nr:oligopeptide:H+ symporter [Legionella lansingensis]KTD23111.1 peptide transport protein, POT family [Legionella lansingensis]SNV51147.1 peptide transport protein, POT family [Legionella lansingensis]
MSIVDSKKAVWNELPQGIVALFFIQIFSTLSFSVLYSTLVLYMTKQLAISPSLANSIIGIFVASNFALHLLGGYCGGRFLSNRALFCFGMLAQIIGCVLLALENTNYLYYGLGFFLTGCGLNVTCINCMLTQRFTPKDNRRETAFLWNYAGMNIGFFIGFTLSGYFQLSQNYSRLFLLSSLGNLIAMFICLYFWHSLEDRKTTYSALSPSHKRWASLGGVTMVLVLPFFLSSLIHFADWANKLIIVTGVVVLAIAVCLALQQPSRDAREKMLAFVVLMLVSTVFWMLYQIGPMGLTHFIENNVQRHWSILTIPPQWFQNINTLCIVIGGPSLSFLLNHMRSRGIQVNIPTQFAFALLFIGLAFAILPIGIGNANAAGLVAPGWVVLCFILQSIGELLISPIGYAMVGALVPGSLQGIMMGMWMLATGVGATLSSYSSNWMTAGKESSLPLVTNSGYSSVFLDLGLFAIAASVLLFLLAPRLRSWINNKQSNQANGPASVPA